jgi:hypothetical protein
MICADFLAGANLENEILEVRPEDRKVLACGSIPNCMRLYATKRYVATAGDANLTGQNHAGV